MMRKQEFMVKTETWYHMQKRVIMNNGAVFRWDADTVCNMKSDTVEFDRLTVRCADIVDVVL